MKNFAFITSLPIQKTFIRFKKIIQEGKLECLKIQISSEYGSSVMEIRETEAFLVENSVYPIRFNGDIATQIEEVFLIDGDFTFTPKHEN